MLTENVFSFFFRWNKKNQYGVCFVLLVYMGLWLVIYLFDFFNTPNVTRVLFWRSWFSVFRSIAFNLTHSLTWGVCLFCRLREERTPARSCQSFYFPRCSPSGGTRERGRLRLNGHFSRLSGRVLLDHDFGVEAAPAGRKESVQVPVCRFVSRTGPRMHRQMVSNCFSTPVINDTPWNMKPPSVCSDAEHRAVLCVTSRVKWLFRHY